MLAHLSRFICEKNAPRIREAGKANNKSACTGAANRKTMSELKTNPQRLTA